MRSFFYLILIIGMICPVYTVAQINSTSYSHGVTFGVGNGPIGVALGDIDGDGKLDIVSANYDTDDFSVLLNLSVPGTISPGSFAPAVHFAAKDGPYGVAVGDLDGDGKVDVAIANRWDTCLTVYRNTSTPGNISFAPMQVFMTGTFPNDVVMSDIDGDGKPDLASSNGGGSISVLRNLSATGSISFATKQDYTCPGCFRIDAGDLNNDGKPDLAMGSRTNEDGTLIYNTSIPGGISFGSPQLSAIGGPNIYSTFNDVSIADFNMDGYGDVLGNIEDDGSGGGSRTTVFYNRIPNNIFSYGSAPSYVVGARCLIGNAVKAADLDLDGKPDLISVSRISGAYGRLNVWRNVHMGVGGATTTASFSQVFSWNTNGQTHCYDYPADIDVGDLDGDGMPDIVTTNGASNSISVHRSGIDNSFSIVVGSTDTLICAGGFINVPVLANGPYDVNNVFTVELSDASGSFANPVVIGSAAAYAPITITCTVPLGTAPGTGYRIRITSSSPQALVSNPSTSITITSTLQASVTISASPGDSVCAGTSISFTATPVNGGSSPTYQWVRNGNNVGANNPVYTSSFSNNEQIACIMTSQMGACATNNPAVSNVITLTVVPLPAQPGSITGSATACTYQATTYSVPAVPGATSYVWSLPSGWTGTSTTNSITVIPGPSSGTISVYAANGCGSSNVRTRSVSSAFPPTVANAGPDQTVCATSATLQGNIPGSGTGQWTRLSGSGTIASASLYNSNVTGLGIGNNVFRWAITTACGTSSDTVVITRTAAPTTANAGSDQNVCSSSATLSGNVPSNGTGTWTLVSGSGTITNPSQNNSTVTNLGNGANVFEWTISSGTCTPSSDQVIITRNIAPIVTASSDTLICQGGTATLTASGASTYTWNPGNISGNTISVSPGSNTTYVVTGTTGGCSATDTVHVMVSSNIAPGITITPSQNNICAGQSVTFTSTVTNGGLTPFYQWYINGNPAMGETGTTFTSNVLVNGDVITCEVTSSSPCWLGGAVMSAGVTMNISPNVTPSISISVPNPTICSGQPATFTATISHGGSSPVYTWQVNGLTTGGNSASISLPGLNTNDVVRCILTSNATCVVSPSDTSNSIVMNVGTSETPAVSITASSSNICSGQLVVFTATPVYGGNNPVFQWQKNGINAGNNSATYTDNMLVNGDVVTCIMTSDYPCATQATATSNAVTVTVTSGVQPQITIQASQNSVCQGASVTFQANISNGGSSPAYTWLVNGNPTGNNNPVFSTNLLGNNDQVTCVLTSSSSCANPQVDTSNVIQVNVSPQVTPAVSISASHNNICPGDAVTFTATPVHPGLSPSYQWKLNGVPVGNNSTTYNTSGLNNGDIVTCELTSSENCASPAIVTSNAITMTVNSSVVPAVSVNASSTSICSGQQVIFTANPVNAGSNPVYQWKVNGSNVGTNSITYTDSGLLQGDVVTVEVISSLPCASPATVSSAPIVIQVMPGVSPAITLTANGGNNCSQQNITIQAAVLYGGNNPSFQWYLNGNPTGNTGAAYTGIFNPGDQVYAVVTSDAACVNPVTATSNTITIDDTPAPPSSFSSNTATVCQGQTNVVYSVPPVSGVTYQWSYSGSGTQINGSGSSVSLDFTNNATSGVLSVTAVNSCGTSAPLTLSITVNNLPGQPGSLSGPATVCPGEQNLNYLVPFAPGVTYTWSYTGTGASISGNSNSVIVGFANNATSGTLLVEAVNSCGTSTPQFLNITVTPAPVVNISAASTHICSGQSITLTASGAQNYQWNPGGQNTAAITVQPSVTTTYIVSGNNGGSCTGTDTLTIQVHPNPVISITGPLSPVCEGSNVNLAASGAVQYQWQPGTLQGSQVVVQPPVTTTYTVVGTDSNGCQGTEQFTVGVNPLPAVTFVLSPSFVCEPDADVLLTGGTPPGGQYSGTGVSAGYFDPSLAGTGTHNIVYTYTDPNGCTNSQTESITVGPCLSVENPEDQKPVIVFPNPATDFVNIEGPESQKVTVDIFDGSGRIMDTYQYSGSTYQVNIEQYAPGPYLFLIRTDGNIHRFTVIRHQ